MDVVAAFVVVVALVVVVVVVVVVVFTQFCSSTPSWQSLHPSHCHLLGMQVSMTCFAFVKQENSSDSQVTDSESII